MKIEHIETWHNEHGKCRAWHTPVGIVIERANAESSSLIGVNLSGDKVTNVLTDEAVRADHELMIQRIKRFAKEQMMRKDK